MGLDVTIVDTQESPSGRVITDLPGRFLSMAITHARKSPQRFRLLGALDPALGATYTEMDRLDLKKEWLVLESLAIGGQERAQWTTVFTALNREKTFVSLAFSAT